MRKINSILSIFVCALVICSCKLDNYDEPNAQIFGGIYDSQTKELIQQDIVNGALIEYLELGWENGQFQYMIFKQDGTYRNNLMFEGDYTIRPVSGNFITPDVQNIIVKGETKADFFVQPYLRIKDCNIVKSGNLVVASFKIEQTIDGSLSSIALFACKESSLGANYYQASSVIPITLPADPEITYTVMINLEDESSTLISGKKYYFRAGAMLNVPGAKYNYAPAVVIEL